MCPHALKSTAGTVLAKRGALANQIAEHLSHEDAEATTMKHYVARADVEQAQISRAFGVIAGGKSGGISGGQSGGQAKTSDVTTGGSSPNRTENLTRMKRLL